MIKFIKSILYFILPVIIYFGFLGIKNYFEVSKILLENKKNIILSKNIIIGDSEIGRLNRIGFYNLTRGGEEYNYILSKLNYLESDSMIYFDTIFIGISPRLLTDACKSDLLTNAENTRRNAILDFVQNFRINKISLHSFIFNSTTNLGFGKGATHSDTQIFSPKVNFQNCHFSSNRKYKNNLNNLNKILDRVKVYCKTIILISMPISREHKKSTPRYVKAIFERDLLLLKNYYIINLYDSTLENIYFKDQNHLNFKGSKLVNKMIEGRLKSF
jgi:hypothetical protein